MNEEYLWNKTGDDEEIRELETLLSVLRQPEAATPPRLPITEAPSRFGWLRSLQMRLASGFAVVLMIGLGTVSFLRTVPPIQTARSGAGDATEAAIEKPSGASALSTLNPDLTVDHSPDDQRPVPVSSIGERRQPKRSQVRLRQFAVRPNKAEAPVRLTAEERYAYDQLKLALAISGSKLQIARDAINGIDTQKTNDESSNR